MLKAGETSGSPQTALLLLFALALSVSAFLLFVVQPMFARLVLPVLGGSPSVWTTCMLFFQSALLVGYAYAHLIIRRISRRSSLVLHAVILLAPLFVLPLAIPDGVRSGFANPTVWLVGVMIASVGLPFVVLATTAPLLQGWFAASGHRAAGDPYFLYATSNAGSVLALVSYPALIEPRLSLAAQTKLWTAGYVMSAVLILLCLGVVSLRRTQHVARQEAADHAPPPSNAQRLEWLALAFVPSSLLLGVTTYLTTDLAVVPLLWVVPLLIYLLTFIIAFSGAAHRAMAITTRLFPLVVLPLVMLTIARGGAALWFALPLHLLTFASISMLCVGRLAGARPHRAHLTEFYLWLAAGGMLAGVFNSIIAPWVFSDVTEYPLMIAIACFVLAVGRGARDAIKSVRAFVRPAVIGLLTAGLLMIARTLALEPREVMALLGPAAVVCFSLSRQPVRFALGVSFMMIAGAIVGTAGWGRVLHSERTFFGVYRVSEDPANRLMTLYHGTTVHGRQQAGSKPPEPLAYYHRGSPIADVLRSTQRDGRSVGVVGLGVGSLAAYARAGERWTFYEIDPAVQRIASDGRFFRFLSSCPDCSVIIGDARITLEHSTLVHDLLVVDAFSSDAIPVHLLTKEALTIYVSRLTASGLLAFHVSNRHVDLRPVLARLARDLGWTSIARFDVVGEGEKKGYSSSDWVVLARDSNHVAGLETARQWAPLHADAQPSWTDDFSNLWAALRWR